MPVCSVLVEEQDVDALASDWRVLHARLGLAPYTDYDWAMIWWRTIGKPTGARLCVVACHEGDKLVGVLPFSVRTTHGVRILRLIGHEAYYYRNFLVEQDAHAPLMWRAMMAAPVFDVCNIKNIHEGTSHCAFWSEQGKRIHTSRVFHTTLSGQIRAELLAAKSKPFRRKHHAVEKKLTEEKGLCAENNRAQAYTHPVLEFLVNRKKEWTIERRKRGVFNEGNVMSFYEEMTDFAAEQGKLFVNWMREDSRFFGVTLNFTEKGIMYGHTLTIDPSYARYMPGIFLNTEALIWASENGMKEMNFMEGEEEYKTRFAKETRTIHEYAYARNLKGVIFLQLYRLLCFYRSKFAKVRTDQKKAVKE